MKLNKFLYNQSYLLFTGFFILALIAFWPSYYSTLTVVDEPRNHTHGIGMTLWCLLLISQSLLIKFKKYHWHKWAGWGSIALVVYMFFSTINLLHHLLGGATNISNNGRFFVALVTISLLAFLVTYGLAIINRKKPLIHGRYMLATIFPMVTPVSDRIIGRHFPELAQYAPTIDGRPILPGLGFFMVDIILIFFIIWDYKSHKTKFVFLTILAINMVYQYCALNLYKFSFWEDFCSAFALWPLS